MYVLQFDIVTIMDVCYVNSNLIVLLCFYAFRESHSFSLHLAIRVELFNWFHSLICRKNCGETPIRIIFELFNSHASTKATAIGQFACMIEEIGVTFIICNTTMVGKRLGVTQRHNLASILPRTCR